MRLPRGTRSLRAPALLLHPRQRLRLPLAALAYHGVQLNIEFTDLSKLIVVSNSNVTVRNARTGLGLTPNDLKADMEVTYCYLDSMEREKFSSSHFEQLIVQTQHYFKSESKQLCRIPLTFNHPTLEIIFGIRRQCQERCNNWGNMSGVDGRDPITHAELLLNTTSRFGKKPALYWRGVVPYQHHSNLPEAIYVMSFALQPEDSLNPSGSCNLSRIDNIELVLDMQSALTNESYTVFIFARSWNILRFREGVAGPRSNELELFQFLRRCSMIQQKFFFFFGYAGSGVSMVSVFFHHRFHTCTFDPNLTLLTAPRSLAWCPERRRSSG